MWLEQLFGVWQTDCKVCLDGSCTEGVGSNSGTQEMGLGSGGVIRFSWKKKNMGKGLRFYNKVKLMNLTLFDPN